MLTRCRLGFAMVMIAAAAGLTLPSISGAQTPAPPCDEQQPQTTKSTTFQNADGTITTTLEMSDGTIIMMRFNRRGDLIPGSRKVFEPYVHPRLRPSKAQGECKDGTTIPTEMLQLELKSSAPLRR